MRLTHRGIIEEWKRCELCGRIGQRERAQPGQRMRMCVYMYSYVCMCEVHMCKEYTSGAHIRRLRLWAKWTIDLPLESWPLLHRCWHRSTWGGTFESAFFQVLCTKPDAHLYTDTHTQTNTVEARIHHLVVGKVLLKLAYLKSFWARKRELQTEKKGE